MYLVKGEVTIAPNADRVAALRLQAARWQASGHIRNAEACDAAAELLVTRDETGHALPPIVADFVNGRLHDLGLGDLR